MGIFILIKGFIMELYCFFKGRFLLLKNENYFIIVIGSFIFHNLLLLLGEDGSAEETFLIYIKTKIRRVLVKTSASLSLIIFS